MNIDKQQLEEQRETNYVLWVNTIATIITGIASTIITIYALWK